jgi:hypothetical protein
MAITVVGTAVVAGTSITIPTHQSGDLIVMFAHASTNGAQPSAPSAGGTVPTWNLLSTSGSTSWSNHRTAYAFGTGSTTSGTWAGSTDMLMVIVLRGADPTTPIGGRASGAVGVGAACTAPAVTLTRNNGTSLLMHFHSWGDGVNGVGTISAVPTGYTRQVGTVASVRLTGVINTKTVSTTSPSIAQSISGGPYNSGATVEVLEASGTTTNITPAGATIAVTGTAPILISDSVLTPAAAAITVTGTAPKLENTVSPPGGSLTGALITITGTAPTLTMSLVTTGDTVTITGGTPSSAGEAVLTPAAATVTVTGSAPTLLVLMTPGSQTLPVTGGTPVLIASAVLSPAAATITITGSAPGLILPLTLTSAGATITITGRAPVLSNVSPPAPAPTSILTTTEFREIEQQLHDRRHAYQTRKVPQPLIRLWDKDMQLIARITIPETWECEEIAHDNGMARIEIVGKDNDWLREILMFKTRPAEDLHITIDPNPDKPHDWKNRWGGKVETLVDEERQGQPTVTTITAVSNRIHLRHILLAAMPVLPHAVQIPKMFLWGGPCVTACASAVMVNLFRIYSLNGWWPIPRNLFAPSTWLENVSPLNWPVQVMPVNPLLDQSRWITIGARWQDAETILKPAMKDAGVICHAYTWLPGDPAPYEAFGPLKDQLKPTRACVILSFEDQSGVGGPTGTAIDGLVNLFAVTVDDLFTETLLAVDGDGDGETDPFVRKLLGVAPRRPPFVYRDTGYGGVLGRTTVVHKSKAITIVVGGRSPGWVNQAIEFGIRYGLSQIANAISSVPGAPAQLSGSEGLDNLYQGQLDDTLLAFMPFVDPRRSAAAGAYARNEHFEQGSGFTISSIMSARQGWWATRPYTSMKFDIDDSLYRIGEDIRLGSRVSAERKGITYTDQIMAIKRRGDRDSSGRPMISFGDDSREEDPVAQGFAAIANVANFAAMLAGSGTL